jgi:hypothetical protein
MLDEPWKCSLSLTHCFLSLQCWCVHSYILLFSTDF